MAVDPYPSVRVLLAFSSHLDSIISKERNSTINPHNDYALYLSF